MTDDWLTLPEFFADDCKEISVASSRQGVPPYRVDLTSYTCSCPDHQTRRRSFPPRDLRRACRHIEQALRDRGISLNEIAQVIMDSDPRGVPPFARWTEFEAAGLRAVATQVEGNEWVDVFARKGKTGVLRRFGFSLAEHRWARGDAPADAQHIRDFISGWTGVKIGARRRYPNDSDDSGEEVVVIDGAPKRGAGRGCLLVAAAVILLVALVWLLWR